MNEASTFNVQITQVLNRTFNGDASYIACGLWHNQSTTTTNEFQTGKKLRFVGTGICPFSEFTAYVVEHTLKEGSESLCSANTMIRVDGSTVISLDENIVPTLSKLSDVKKTQNNGRLNTIKSVIVSCDDLQEIEGGGKRRKLRVVDESVSQPVNVMAYKDAAEECWSPGEVILFHRPKVYAPEGSEYRSISVFEKTVKSGNDERTEMLRALYKAKYTGESHRVIDNIELLQNAEFGEHFEFTGIVVKADTPMSRDAKEGRPASRFQNIYISDSSNKFVHCVVFNTQITDDNLCDKVVTLKVKHSNSSGRKNFLVNGIEEVKNGELENWWATMMFTDLQPLFKVEVRDEKTVSDIAEYCKEWADQKKRVSVRGNIVQANDGMVHLLGEDGSKIEIKQINAEMHLLSMGDCTVLIENAPVNMSGITVFADTQFHKC